MAGNIDQYKNQSLKIIDSASILEQSDFDKLATLKDELQDNFLHTQIFRTRTEMEVSVLGDIRHPTPDSKYWQAQREQSIHFTELVYLSYEYRKNLIEIKKLQHKLDNETDDLEKELISIEIEKKSFISKDQERIAKDRIREIVQWHEIKANLIPKMKYSLIDVNEHQLTSYAVEFIKQLNYISDKITQDEKLNLLDKLQTTLKVCREKGLLDRVAGDLTPNELTMIKNNGFI